MTNEYIKPPVEIRYKNELDALKSVDIGKKPENWVLSPKAVRTFILGGIIKTADGKMQIKRKFYGNDALVERCIITLAGNRGLMLIKYSWNYAMLLSKGPCREALVPAPLLIGMEQGIFARFEEITRTPAEIQDSLISVMSDQILNIPELENEGLVFAKQGFNIIGTANTRDKGVNEMSGALKRRFNFETVEPCKNGSYRPAYRH